MHTVETHRLQLRMFAPSDMDDLCRLLSDPEVIRYVGTGEPILEEEAGTILTSILAHWGRHGYGRWAAVDKATEKFIGMGGLRTLIDTPEVVYHLAKSRWGLGLATEMAHASLRYGFEEHGFERIVAVAKPENTASIHVMEKVGMRYQKHETYYGIEVVQYMISRDDYQPDDSTYVLRRA
jgi:RimJ/RimL family protein N-acetyltransferase